MSHRSKSIMGISGRWKCWVPTGWVALIFFWVIVKTPTWIDTGSTVIIQATCSPVSLQEQTGVKDQAGIRRRHGATRTPWGTFELAGSDESGRYYAKAPANLVEAPCQWRASTATGSSGSRE